LEKPSKFQWVLRLRFFTALTSLSGGQPNFARCLAVSWAGALYIHFWGSLRPSFAFSCIGSVTARHPSSGRQPNFVVYLLIESGRYARHYSLVCVMARHEASLSVFWLPYSDPQSKPITNLLTNVLYCFCEIHIMLPSVVVMRMCY